MRLGLAAVVFFAAMLRPAAAAEIEGVTFAEQVEADGATLHLHNVGLLWYRIFFKGYVAALYLPSGVPAAKVLTDVPKRLEIEYFWSIDGDQFGPAGEKVLRENVSADTVRSLRERLDRIDALYPSVRPGDRLSLTYVPGKGTTLARNDEPLGTIEGADFAAAYFAIWLGPEPIDADLRNALLEPRGD